MTGKEKCTLLKQIRREIAESNGIPFQTEECDFDGYCPGYCPKCDEEIRFLDDAINRKALMGEKITLSGISVDTFDEVYASMEAENNACSNQDNEWDIPDGPMLAGIPCDSFENERLAGLMDVDEDDSRSNNDEVRLSKRPFGAKIYKSLEKAGIGTFSDLCSYSREELLSYTGLNSKDIDRIESKLSKLHMSLTEDD